VSFYSLLQVMEKLKKNHAGFSKKFEEAQVLGQWDALVGAPIAKYTKVLRVHDAVLWVKVDHPLWRSELHYQKHAILENLNRASSTIVFKDIRFC
jgi:predicted nucleic acid-binding Zn ribbon protein